MLGYPDQARGRMREALSLAHELSHPLSMAVALTHATTLHQFCQEVQATQEQAESAITLCSEQQFPYWLETGTVLRGWALTEQGQREEGMARLHQGLAAYQATGAETLRPYFLTLLAEEYGKGGRTEEGLSVLAEALTLVDKTGERYYEAELYRLKGELTLQQQSRQVSDKFQTSQDKSEDTDPRSLTPDPQGEAEASFRKAIEVSRKQQAKSLELRATMSLARLWQSQGKKTEAHQMLSEIYNWFTEGFDTKDLQEAKALLKELA